MSKVASLISSLTLALVWLFSSAPLLLAQDNPDTLEAERGDGAIIVTENPEESAVKVDRVLGYTGVAIGYRHLIKAHTKVTTRHFYFESQNKLDRSRLREVLKAYRRSTYRADELQAVSESMAVQLNEHLAKLDPQLQVTAVSVSYELHDDAKRGHRHTFYADLRFELAAPSAGP